ncbi:hypothetical protein [Methylobacterium sp. WL6]|uniref:hypothetical protein n=1 Tax=Methylobacterium sp. WL6 TaxID=2603901 RepID=UPI0011C9F61A|nr:hypothetical protein [Methylobacterium sp. WL6]TXN60428.1 hypothetical protein FV230_26135 [Methylobacterium sp. WL6]
MATGTIRVELHPPGTTPQHRGSAPIASATLTISGTTPTDPNALPTVQSLVPGGLTGPCIAFVTPSFSEPALWCSVGKVPDPSKEPRHLLTFSNIGLIQPFTIEIGPTDRIAFASVA